MYDTNRLVAGGSFLVLSWLLLGLFVVSSGVAVALPMRSTDGFNLTFDRATVGQAISYPGETEITGHSRYPVAVFELQDVRLTDLVVTKELNISSIPGVNGRMRLVIEGKSSVTTDTLLYETDHFTADRVTWRGFVMDERYEPTVFDRFVVTAGPAPQETAGEPTDIEGSGGQPGYEVYDGHVRAYRLVADDVSVRNLRLGVQYDPDADGTYEYGVAE